MAAHAAQVGEGRSPYLLMLAALTAVGLPALDARDLSLTPPAPEKVVGVSSRMVSPVANGAAKAVPTLRTHLPQGSTLIAVVQPAPGQLASSIDRPALIAAGATVIAESAHLLRVAVPAARVRFLPAVPGVYYVRPPWKPTLHRTTSEGLRLINASPAHSLGLRGGGVKVAVIDGGFAGADLLPSDLPGSLSTLDYTGDGMYSGVERHGTACAEIIHDIAPEAELLLLRTGDLVDLENAKDLCIRDGVDVISYSGSWIGTGFGDGGGLACEIVDDAADNDVLWVNSAGNYARRQYAGEWADRDSDSWHDFGIDEETLILNDAEVGDTISLWLTWDDWPRSFHDYDLHLLREDSSGKIHVVDSSTDWQLGTPPVEHIEREISLPGPYFVAVEKSGDATPIPMKVWSAYHDIGTAVSIGGTIGSPADARGAYAVGAIHHLLWRHPVIETYSSRGPTADGRVKPDIVGPTGVSTTSYGLWGFGGTSAAAPHVAAAAALVKCASPDYSAQQLAEALSNAAMDLGDRGKDNTFGSGRLRLPALDAEAGPAISSISPTSVVYGETITLEGSHFGAERRNSRVVFYPGVEPRSWEYVNWGPSQIRTRVPTGVRSGSVVVATDHGTSNGVHVEVDADAHTSVLSTLGFSPTVTGFAQPHPVSFNASVALPFHLSRSSHVSISIANALGQRVSFLYDGHLEAGSHSVRWDGSDHCGARSSSGVYFVVLEAGDTRAVTRVVRIE